MFDRAIIDTDRFMDLSMSAKALYFLLGMEADDEGFVSYKKVMRIHGGNEDDIRVLIAKNFLISFQSGVVVITDWNKNNWLDTRRIKETEYQKEKQMLSLTDKKEYVLSNRLTSIEEYRVEESRGEQTETSSVDEIPLLIKAFEAINPASKRFYNNTTQRKACQSLISEYGLDRVLTVIEKTLPKTNGLQFFPTITTPLQLNDKWVALESAVRKYQAEKQTTKNKVAF